MEMDYFMYLIQCPSAPCHHCPYLHQNLHLKVENAHWLIQQCHNSKQKQSACKHSSPHNKKQSLRPIITQNQTAQKNLHNFHCVWCLSMTKFKAEVRASLTHSSIGIPKSSIHRHVTVAKVPIHSAHSWPVHISTQETKCNLRLKVSITQKVHLNVYRITSLNWTSSLPGRSEFAHIPPILPTGAMSLPPKPPMLPMLSMPPKPPPPLIPVKSNTKFEHHPLLSSTKVDNGLSRGKLIGKQNNIPPPSLFIPPQPGTSIPMAEDVVIKAMPKSILCLFTFYITFT